MADTEGNYPSGGIPDPQGDLQPGYHWIYDPEAGHWAQEPDAPFQTPPFVSHLTPGTTTPGGGAAVTGAPLGYPYNGAAPGGGGGGVQKYQTGAPPAFGAYPMFDAPHYDKPADFSYAGFTQPTLADAQNEPGYQFALTEGRKALENSAAGRGTLRTGGTLKDILAWGNQFAEQNYGNVYNRAANTYTMNRGNAFDNYKLNLDAGLNAYDRYFQEASSEYAPKARAFELQSARDWDAYVYGEDDKWRRYASDVGILGTIYGGGK